MMIHGGYWQAIYNLTHAGHLCVDLAAHGIATWNVEYRRIGDPGGGWPAAFDDVRARARHTVRCCGRSTCSICPRVVVMGHSAGGHLALLCAQGGSGAGASRRFAFGGRGSSRHRSTGRRQRGDHPHARRQTGGSGRDVGRRPRRVPICRSGSATCSRAGRRTSIGSRTRCSRARRGQAGDDVELLPLPGAGHFELVDPVAPEWAADPRASCTQLLL